MSGAVLPQPLGVLATPQDTGGRRSTCKICRLGIYRREPAVWLRGQYLGLNHTECAARAGATGG